MNGQNAFSLGQVVVRGAGQSFVCSSSITWRVTLETMQCILSSLRPGGVQQIENWGISLVLVNARPMPFGETEGDFLRIPFDKAGCSPWQDS